MRRAEASGKQQLSPHARSGFVGQPLEALRGDHGSVRVVLDQKDSRVVTSAAHELPVQHHKVRDVLAHETSAMFGSKRQLLAVAPPEHPGLLGSQGAEAPTREDFRKRLAKVLVEIEPGRRHLAFPVRPAFPDFGQPLLVGAVMLLDQRVNFLGMILRVGERVKNLRQRQARILSQDFLRRQARAPVLGNDAHGDPRALDDWLSAANAFHASHVRMFRQRLHGAMDVGMSSFSVSRAHRTCQSRRMQRFRQGGTWTAVVPPRLVVFLQILAPITNTKRGQTERRILWHTNF